MKNNVVVLKNYQMTQEVGKHFRLLCMTGDKRGEVYYLKSKRVVLGRSAKADIKIFDNQSSREHAELIRMKDQYVLTDLNSNNGVIVNGKKIKQSALSHKDRIIIGKTVYKFEIVTVGEEEEEVEVTDEELFEEEEEKKKKYGLYALVGIVLFVLLTLDDEKPQARKTLQPQNDLNDEFVKIQKQRQYVKDKKVQKQLDVIMQRGIRELREKNYLRSISEFNMALILSPQNARAKAYKDKAKQQFDKEVDLYFAKAAREFESLNFINSIRSYCSIIKMLELYPNDERRKTAEKNIKDIIINKGVKESEGRCN